MEAPTRNSRRWIAIGSIGALLILGSWFALAPRPETAGPSEPVEFALSPSSPAESTASGTPSPTLDQAVAPTAPAAQQAPESARVSATPSPQDEPTLQVTVKTETGEPIAGLEVLHSDVSKPFGEEPVVLGATDAEGRASGALAPGEYHVSVNEGKADRPRPKLETGARMVTIGPDGASVDFVLRALGSGVVVEVVDASGLPVPDIAISTNTGSHRLQTGPDGIARLEGLPSGHLRIDADLGDRLLPAGADKRISRSVELAPNRTMTERIELPAVAELAFSVEGISEQVLGTNQIRIHVPEIPDAYARSQGFRVSAEGSTDFFPVLPGAYTARLLAAAAGLEQAEIPLNLTLEDGERRTITIRAVPAAAALHVLVVDETGAAVPNMRVNLAEGGTPSALSGGVVHSKASNDQGEAVFGVRLGLEYVVVPAPFGYRGEEDYVPAVLEPIQALRTSEAQTSWTVQVHRASILELDERPPNGVRLAVTGESGTEEFPPTLTKRNAVYVPRLPAGEYSVVLRDADGGQLLKQRVASTDGEGVLRRID